MSHAYAGVLYVSSVRVPANMVLGKRVRYTHIHTYIHTYIHTSYEPEYKATLYFSNEKTRKEFF
jgi:hypothetical protein